MYPRRGGFPKNGIPVPGDNPVHTMEGPMSFVSTENLLTRCTLCPRECGANRLTGTGYCNAGDRAAVNLHRLHFWEEPVLSGQRGSGTIFFSHCAMRCAYCQNHLISQEGRGTLRSAGELCDMMLDLQEAAAHNVNLVTASHYAPQAAAALRAARVRGLRIPVVWNSSAYEKKETLRLLEGLVDIYLPDFRYIDGGTAGRYSLAADYPERAKDAIREMLRQKGHLRIEDGIAVSGLMIRILILPGQAEAAGRALEWIHDALGPETWISLMGQYYPAYRAASFPEIDRPVTPEEYGLCLERLEELGFENGFSQEVGSSGDYTPEFT